MISSEEPLDPQLITLLDSLKMTPSRNSENALRGRSVFLEEAAQLRTAGSKADSGQIARRFGWPLFFGSNHRERTEPKAGFRLSTAAVVLLAGVIVLFLLGGTGVTVYAAQSALPGDALFPVKHATEDARITLSQDPREDASLHLLFAQRRLEEISSLIGRDRFENISLGTNEFESHIFGAIAAVKVIGESDPVQSELLAEQISATLSDYAAELTRMVSSVPVDRSREALEKAYRASSLTVTRSQVEFTAFVDSVGSDRWVIGGLEVLVDDQTEISPGIEVNDIVEVHAGVADNNRLVAHEIELASMAEDSEFEVTGVVESISPGVWIVGGQEIIVALETDIEGSIRIGDLVKVEARRETDGRLIALAIGISLEENEDNDSQNSQFDEFEFTGFVESMGAEFWIVDGQQVRVTADTEIKDSIQIGDQVKIKAYQDGEGVLTALEIEADDSGDDADEFVAPNTFDDDSSDDEGQGGEEVEPEEAGGQEEQEEEEEHKEEEHEEQEHEEEPEEHGGDD